MERLFLKMLHCTSSKIFFGHARIVTPCTGRSSAGKEAIVETSETLRCCEKGVLFFMMGLCFHTWIIYYEQDDKMKQKCRASWMLEHASLPWGFDEDQDGEWWPPPLTEQDVATRQRATRLLQAGKCWKLPCRCFILKLFTVWCSLLHRLSAHLKGDPANSTGILWHQGMGEPTWKCLLSLQTRQGFQFFVGFISCISVMPKKSNQCLLCRMFGWCEL